MERKIQYFRDRVIKELDEYFSIPEDRLTAYGIKSPHIDYHEPSISTHRLMEFFTKVLISIYHKSQDCIVGWNDFGFYPEEKLKEFRNLEMEYKNWVKPAIYQINDQNNEIQEINSPKLLDYESDDFKKLIIQKSFEFGISAF